jgi:hypothetical protein
VSASAAVWGIGPAKAAEIAAKVEALARKVIASKGRMVCGTAASAHGKEPAASLPRLTALARGSMEVCR